MIQIESIHIEELRGIRDLSLTMGRKNFVISGPNGSGKSGVVDAIQFAITGDIARLRGSGTGDITLGKHGPHVEKRDYPDASFVELNVYIPSLGKSASITRNINSPKQATIHPDQEDVVEVFNELAEHPEIILSRREIIRFILTEATQRSRDVQTLLKLDGIDQTRSTLKTAENQLRRAYTSAKTQADSAANSLQRHLDLPELKSVDLLEKVNQHRKVLGLPEIHEFSNETSVSSGISEDTKARLAADTKDSVLRDLKALIDVLSMETETSSKVSVSELLSDIAEIQGNEELLSIIKQRPFIQSGLEYLDGPNCPLCDTEWVIEDLRAHLEDKLQKSEKAQRIRDRLLGAGETITREAVHFAELVAPIVRIPEIDAGLGSQLSEWVTELRSFASSTGSVEGVVVAKQRFQVGWTCVPSQLLAQLLSLEEKVRSRPDKSATDTARDFLVVAKERISKWRTASRDSKHKELAATKGSLAYKTYCDTSEAALLALYQSVEQDFGKFYQLLNHDDESTFSGRLEPEHGKLGLLVDFHDKGMFPPGAYHSEGHQDGMGICLYLALMKQVLGAEFSIAVLDDVVMSVDSQHRRQFCKLLKTCFPSTQFIITTHDQVWARQIRSEGVVDSSSAIAFHTWTVDTGPVLDEVAEIWDQIDADLAKNEVPTAAGRLRRHLEYVAAELADEWGTPVVFRGDGAYEMGDLLSAVIGRQGKLLKSAMKAANSWNDPDEIEKVTALMDTRSACLAKWGGEQWIINKAVHYNEWANLSKEDFRPVVSAIRELLQLFRCENPPCGSWLSLTPRKEPTDLRCACGAFRINLNCK